LINPSLAVDSLNPSNILYHLPCWFLPVSQVANPALQLQLQPGMLEDWCEKAMVLSLTNFKNFNSLNIRFLGFYYFVQFNTNHIYNFIF